MDNNRELYRELDNLESQLQKIAGMQIPGNVDVEQLKEISIDVKNLLMSVSEWLDNNEHLNN